MTPKPTDTMPRFTIKQLMQVIVVVACVLGAAQVAGFVVLAATFFLLTLVPGTVLLVWGAYRLTIRWRPRLAVLGFALSAMIVNVSFALSFAYFYDGFYTIGVLIVAAIAFLPFVIGSGLAWVANVKKSGRIRGAFAAAFTVFGMTVLPLSMMMTTPWPLPIAFSLSRPAMERLADRVESGGSMAVPEWVGVYRVIAAERDAKTGNVALLTDAHLRSGFVRVVDSAKPAGPLGGFNVNEALVGPWRYQTEE